MTRHDVTIRILQLMDGLGAQKVDPGYIATGVLQAAVLTAQMGGVSRAIFFDAVAEVWDQMSGDPPPG